MQARSQLFLFAGSNESLFPGSLAVRSGDRGSGERPAGWLRRREVPHGERTRLPVRDIEEIPGLLQRYPTRRAGRQVGREVDVNGVRIIGLANLPGTVAINASQMFSSNLYSLVADSWNTEEKRFELNFEDEIIKGCVITHDGEIVNAMIANHYADK